MSRRFHDDGPSDEDLDRFSGDSAHCPHCGALVYDDAWSCPSCGEVIEGRTSHLHPDVRSTRQRLWLVLAITISLILSGLIVLVRLL